MDKYEQVQTGSMIYPRKGSFNRLLYKTPLFLWRTGLGPWLSHPSRGGNRMLALTTRGRISGQPRHTLLSQARIGGVDYVCSGWGLRSDWIQNIKKDSLVMVQSGKEAYSARAYRVEDLNEYTALVEEIFRTGGDSHFEPWLVSYGIDFNPADMIAKRDRLHIYGFEPVDDAGLSLLKTDLWWFWPVIGILTVMVGVLLLIEYEECILNISPNS